MEVTEGFLDTFNFPCVRLQFADLEDPEQVRDDTGFNREMLIPFTRG